jgi:mannose-6-phosphate isomerase
MLSSANVLRAALTHKLRDLDNLLALISYSSEQPCMIAAEEVQSCQNACGASITHYNAPDSLFGISVIQTSDAAGEVDLAGVHGPSFLLCTSGKGILRVDGQEENICFGTIFFIRCRTPIYIQNGSKERLVCYRACTLRMHT